MNTRVQTNNWIFRTMIILGFILFMSVISTIGLLLIHQPVPELLIIPGSVAGTGLMQLLISPLNHGLQT